MKMLLSVFLATSVAMGVPALAATETIDFEGLAAGSAVGTIGNATFSGSGGIIVYDFGGDYASSGVNTVGPTGGNFNGDLFVDFASYVSGLTFFSGGDNDVGRQASINVFVDGLFAALVDLTGDGDPSTVEQHDLSAFSNISRIEIFDVTDAAGLVYDDFSYTYDEVAPVPLPASAGFLLASFVGLGAMARRRSRIQ